MNAFINKLCIKGMIAKHNLQKKILEERGEANIIAIILVLAIVIALAIVFRSAIGKLFNSIWDGITGQVGDATSTYPEYVAPTGK